jgi:dipeptidyl aminopeptidase/acylaminoacyl peptidase
VNLRRILVSLALAAMLPAQAIAADLSGTWSGTWTKDGDAVPVTVTIGKTGKGYSGTFDSDALQAAGIPFSEVTEKGGKVHIVLKDDETATNFDGVLKGDAINGTLAEGDGKGTFSLTRAPAPAATVSTRDVTFTDGDVTIAGTLILPAAPGPHPAAMFLHGSGPEGRWANRWLAEKFAEAGIVALITDKRGVGGSTGDWKSSGFDTLADDAAAGIRFLEKQQEVDPGRVGIYGHSQGGTIAPLVRERAPETAFIVASAAGGIPPAELEAYSIENSIGLPSLPPAEQEGAKAFVKAIVDVAYRGHPRGELDAAVAKYKGRDWYFDPPPAGDFYWSFARRIADFVPMEHWRKVRIPVLLLYGAHDRRVPAIASASAIRTAIATSARHERRDINVKVRIYPDADHAFAIVDPPPKGGWPRHEPDYARTITDWIKGAETRGNFR